jgi:hypothetical protein
MWVVELVDGLVFVGKWQGGECLVLVRVYHLSFDLAVDLLHGVNPALR